MSYDIDTERLQNEYEKQLEKQAEVLAKEKNISFQDALQHVLDAQKHDESTGKFDDTNIPQ
ncbi:hypothetical protein ACIL20_001668 [Vibrio vulnificus]|uniref:Uncharacterized protein n=1 Tax=Vibrio ichthyoenteri ATCC 700023 TaxID=870968 RepID=F9S2X5_9VIBR|nr:hypothetical protein [Vibrio ichthyoenteri]EGU38798.1 hypothetical protein VII00023_14991 [Vibrio ichthyoenteri ATCC 700023]